MRFGFSAEVYEAYSQSEGIILSITSREDLESEGTVGGPGPNVKFRLRYLQ